MKEAKLSCVRCGHESVVKIFEPGEAERKGIPGYPIRCAKCGGEVRESK